MKRIVLIGNGFDKAHGLPTGYNDFEKYLTDSIARFEKTSSYSHRIVANGNKCHKNYNLYHRIDQDGKEDPWLCAEHSNNETSFNLVINPHSEKKSIYFKSLFEDSKNLGYWSNLESHYFKNIIKHKNEPNAIKIINQEFEHLKELLKQYIQLEIENNTGDGEKYSVDTTGSIYQMLKNGHNDYDFENTHFVSFNYTSKILNQFIFWLRTGANSSKFSDSVIHVHGDLVNPRNPIIFGYGDENSNDYKELELLLNNELLVNFKTFQYLRSNTYKQVLGLLEDDKDIYIQLIGHSCGLCDKALLRTIFQHKNVKHIESTYYKSEKKYFENLYNISRIFDDNTLMRKKVIPLNETFMI